MQLNSFQAKQETDAFVMIVTLITVFAAFGLLFFSCEIGQRFTSKFDTLNCVFNQFKWYTFPIEVQRMLPMIIRNAQQPVTIRCFGRVMCLRESFRKVSSLINTKLNFNCTAGVDLLYF